ncbi:NADH-quinone oxidoreductase subunit C [Streptomyces sp. LP11]|uniref:NADH-quinone oxidoreductase subunit C n=1 Tax=Streptomyces pyxinicus TaxID=2970331 RepID=A0ABT2B316_9ACTN|nr:NADH-quinone oxidoreductase subunit C [Streptomyces sp. LP11]MCS0602914.1 NADH-quinone oxidoreductase subunit C [Streptomyces sp. LP11]
MSTAGWLPAPAEELFGPDAVAEESYDVLTVDVPPSAWLTALETARTTLSCTYFDWLSAVDEPGTGFRISAHVVALGPVRRLLVRTTVPHEAPALPSAVDVYAGAGWHERETHEMFGVVFEGHPGLEHLLLPETFEGHPLRKDFVLAARVAKAWPGAKEPGESEHGGPKRRQMLPPGVPDPNEWGPLKGQLPPAPARPARGAARPAGATGERPVRRTRTAAAGSASQTGEAATPAEAPATPATPAEAPAAPAPARPRRTRSASQGSASQTAPDAGAETAANRKQAATEDDAATASAAPGPAAEASVAHEPGPAPPSAQPSAPARPRRARSASEGSSSQRDPAPEPREPAEPTEPAQPPDLDSPGRRTTAPRSADAPWHHARPAFDEPEPTEEQPAPDPKREREPAPKPDGKPPTPEPPAGGPQ